MSAPLFFHAAGTTGVSVWLDETAARHAVQVLRMQPGDAIALTNGAGLLQEGIIADTGKRQCEVHLHSTTLQPRLVSRRVGIAVAPTKNAGSFEWLLEKVTEIGVTDIYPLLTHRTGRSHMRQERLQQICISAMLQSRQYWLPVLHPPVAMLDLLRQPAAAAYHHRWIAHCAPYEKHSLAKALQPGMPDSLLLIGPEGDFTDAEIFAAIEAGFQPVTLGPTRLRTETAGMVGAALMCMV